MNGRDYVPGPWMFVPRFPLEGEILGPPDERGGREVVAWCGHVKSPDGRLMAAAPDLLACLIEVRYQFLDGAQVGWSKRMLDRADAAIAAADQGDRR